MGQPTVTLDSRMAFNEVSFGFVPHAGSSFYLSRLPGELGTFLSLTGLPITGIDAMRFGLAEELVHTTRSYEDDVSDILTAMEFPIPSARLNTNYYKNKPWLQHLQEKSELKKQ